MADDSVILPLDTPPGGKVSGQKFEAGLSNLRSIQNYLNDLYAKAALAKVLALRTVKAASVATSDDDAILGDCTGAAFRLTMYAAKGNLGRVIRVKKTDAGANNLTVAALTGETIDGAATLVLTAAAPSATLVSDGTRWHTL